MNTQLSSDRLYIPALAGFYEGIGQLGFPILRVATGLMLMPHGAQKLFGMFGGGGIDGTVKFFTSIGIEPALPLVYLVGCTELIGGFLLAIGLFTRFAAAGIAIQMAVIAFHVKFANGYFLAVGPKLDGYQMALLWGFAALAFALQGGGRYSVDRAIGKEL